MSVTFTSLEALILKATSEHLPCPDSVALDAFCAVMRDSPVGPHLAAQALAARIHSLNPREAMLALSMLDRCMRRGDENFHAEIGKFRFLNEMIKLVSPKYFADRTAPEVKTRVLQLLHAWAIEYPKESKFKVAYDMLKNQGVVKETPPPLPPEDGPQPNRARATSAILEDSEKSKLLQKLLQSKKPEDLQHANRLIKTMVREEERRTEVSSRCAQEAESALGSAELLREMLQHAIDGEVTADEEQLIHELHAGCVRQRPILEQLAAADPEGDHIYKVSLVSQVIDEVMAIYNKFLIEKNNKSKVSKVTQEQSTGDSLLDFAGSSAGNSAGDASTAHSKNAIDELGDIFSSEASSTTIVEPLKPFSLLPKDDIDLLGDKTEKAEGWNELDSLGEQLLKQSLPDSARRLDGFTSKSTKKIPMNELEKLSPRHDSKLSNSDTILDLDFFTKAPLKQSIVKPATKITTVPSDDVIMVDIGDNTATETINGKVTAVGVNNGVAKDRNPLDSILDLASSLRNQTTSPKIKVEDKICKKEPSNCKPSEIKPLTDLNLTLDSVTPSKVPPLTIFDEEDGLTVVLHFCKDQPRPDVNIIVISTTSKKTSPIEDYKVQAIVPKGHKVRLLPPSGTSLPARHPFLPPPAVTQLLLLARPLPASAPAPAPALRFVVTYVSDDDTCSEIGEVAQLPLPADL